MKHCINLLSQSLLLLGLAVPTLIADMNIVSKESNTFSTIVIPNPPSEITKYAANELQYHIQKATGVKLAISLEKDSSEKVENNIYVGPTKTAKRTGINVSELKNNEGIIKVTTNGLYLLGKDGNGKPPFDDTTSAGTLFAVYEWIESQLNVKWLWPGDLGTVTPKLNNVDAGTIGVKNVIPGFIHTKLRYGSLEGRNWRGVISRKAYERNKYDTAVWLRRHRFTRQISFEYGHAFIHYWKMFGKIHPEWFALTTEGKRGPIDQAYKLVQMCVSNPEFHKQIVSDWLKNRTQHKPWINCAENDKRAIDPSCNCEKCRSWDSGEKLSIDDGIWNIDTNNKNKVKKTLNISLSDRYAKFYLAVQKEARKYDPDATIVAYAYAGYVQPPTKTKLNKNIIVWIVPPYFFPLSDSAKNDFRKLWDGWRRTGARLVLRPNYYLAGYCMPYIFANEFGNEFRYAAKNGMIGTDFDSLTAMWGVQGPNLYMLARLSEKPQMLPKEVLEEFYSGFGAAAKHVKDYFKYWEEVTKKGITSDFLKKYGMKAHWSRFYGAADKVYTLRSIKKGFALLELAKKSVDNDPAAEKRVDFLRKGLQNAKLSVLASIAFQKYTESPLDANLKNNYHQALKKLDAYRRSIEGENIVNAPWLNWSENMTWSRKAIRMMNGFEVVKQLPLFWKFKWDPTKVGKKNKWYASEINTNNWLKTRTDKCWEDQSVGRDWKIKHKSHYNGWAWYSTDFSISNNYKQKKRILLLFGAVDEACDIWCNGIKVLERPYPNNGNTNSWMTPFTVDITKAVRFGMRNKVVVKVVDNSGKGGIYKPVSIVTD